FRFLNADGWSSLFGVVRAFDDVTDLRLDADAKRADEVNNLLCATDILVERLVGVIYHHMRESRPHGAQNRLRRLAMIQRDGDGNGGVGSEKFEQHSGIVKAAVFEIRLVTLDDKRRLQFLGGFDDSAADVVTAAVVVEGRHPEAFGRSLIAKLFCVDE